MAAFRVSVAPSRSHSRPQAAAAASAAMSDESSSPSPAAAAAAAANLGGGGGGHAHPSHAHIRVASLIRVSPLLPFCIRERLSRACPSRPSDHIRVISSRHPSYIRPTRSKIRSLTLLPDHPPSPSLSSSLYPLHANLII